MKNATRDEERETAIGGRERSAVRCLSRRAWDWGRSWRETLVHLVWFWRIGVVLAIMAAFIYAWSVTDVAPRVIGTVVLFGLIILLAFDLFTAIFNLPLLAFYAALWCLLTLTSLVDVFFFGRYLNQKQNHIAVLVLFANFALGIAAAALWASLRANS